jgi:hypothetical protein
MTRRSADIRWVSRHVDVGQLNIVFLREPASASGQKRSRQPRNAISGLPRTTDIVRPPRHVRFVPRADIRNREIWLLNPLVRDNSDSRIAES